MADAVTLEKKIIDLIKIKEAFAIALTGDWGIGKTYFWSGVIKKNEDVFYDRKYAYISLFGLDSLQSLKSAIAIEVHKSYGEDISLWKKDIIKPAKKFISSFTGSSIGSTSSVRIGLNISNSFINNTILSHLKDTIVCLDDIERKSDSLPMSEILGLVNYLKNERNCQVIVILHDEKSEDKKYFDKHKEKVFDDFLILDDSLSIIKNFVESQSFPIYEKFYNTIGIKNLRFYQRVDNSFKAFNKNLNNLSVDSREQILKFMLIVRMMFDTPYIIDDDINFKFFIDSFSYKNIRDFRNYKIKNAYKDTSEVPTDILKFNKINELISPFYNYFEISDWGEIVVSWVINLNFDQQSISKLIEEDKINEKNLIIDRLTSKTLREFHNMEIEPDFPERLYYLACANIGRTQLSNLSFYCDILEAFNKKELANQLYSHVQRYIEGRINYSDSKITTNTFYPFDRKESDRFYNLINDKIQEYKYNNISYEKILRIFIDFHQSNRSGYNNDREAMEMLSKDILKKIIWVKTEEIIGNRKLFVHSILLYPILNEIPNKREEVRLWIIDLLKEKILENPYSKASINMWLEETSNLTENLN